MSVLEPLSTPFPASTPMQVADVLRERILRSSDGELLGSEVELIERFGVSRPSFRQAVRILQAEGVLVVKRGVGGGLFAAPPTADSVARSLSVLLRHQGITFSELNGAIHALTGEMARQAAAHRSKADRARVAKQIRACNPPEDQSEVERIWAAGANFGTAVGSLAAMPVIQVLLLVLVDLLTRQKVAPPTKGHYEDLRGFHLAMADAIAAGDELEVLRICDAFRRELDRWT